MGRLTRDGIAEPVSRDQLLRREQRGQRNIHFPCSADHEQDWQPYPVDPYSCCVCDHTNIITTLVKLYNILCRVDLEQYFSQEHYCNYTTPPPKKNTKKTRRA